MLRTREIDAQSARAGPPGFPHASVAAGAAFPGVLAIAPPRFPLGDWQFWAVTIVALVAASWIAWKLLPKRLLGKRRRPPVKHATLTVGGRPVDRAHHRGDCH